MSTTSSRIQKGMELRGFKQADLVERTGISKGALSSYISGRYSPKQNNIYLIAKALDVNEAWLMGADVPMERVSEKPVKQIKSYPTHCKEIMAVCEQLSEYNRSKVLTYSKNLLSTQQMEYELVAAHARTDIDVTEEDIQHDLDLMDDDGWE